MEFKLFSGGVQHINLDTDPQWESRKKDQDTKWNPDLKAIGSVAVSYDDVIAMSKLYTPATLYTRRVTHISSKDSSKKRIRPSKRARQKAKITKKQR